MRLIRSFLSIFFFICIVLIACKKDFSRQPVVTTGDFDLTHAIAHGTLVDIGTREITDHGFCWDSLAEPSIVNQTIRLGQKGSAGTFQAQLKTLVTSTTYFLRAYITFGEEILYGQTITFTTPDLPLINTSSISGITDSIAISGGNIPDDSGSPVLLRGVCWGTTSNPDTTGSHTNDGSDTGQFSSVLSGLSANTQYYVRAYATSIYGTRYAEELTFNTGQSGSTPFVSTYPVSAITQTTATSGGNVVADGGFPVTLRGVCWSTTPYPTTSDSKTEDGNGTGVFSSSLSGLTSNTIYYVRAYATNNLGTAYGNEIGFTTGQNITTPIVYTNEVTSIVQTTATCGGNVIGDGGAMVTVRGICWSTSPNPTTEDSKTIDGNGIGSFVSYLSGLSANTLYYVTAYATNSVGTAYGNQVIFTTLSNPVLPTVTTNDATNIAQTTATSGGNVTSDGGTTVTAKGVCWNTSPNPTITNSYTTDGSGNGVFVSNLTGLTPNTLYYVRAYATNSIGTVYGNEITFTTIVWQCGNTITHESQIYNTVLIGTHCWMKENLNVGVMILGNQNQTNNSLIEKYCYNNDPANCSEYGGLYQWDEMMQYVTIPGIQGICMSGWHIPTDDELKILEGTVDSQYGVGNYIWDQEGYRGFDAGKNLKSITGWINDGNGTNSFGFNAIPGGYRNQSGNFYGLTYHATFWSSMEYSTIYAWSRELDSTYDSVGRYYNYKTFGYSVRCVQN